MHRHGYIGRKLQMAAAPRRALIRGQVTSLVLHEAITTTEAKAKEVAPHFERLVTYAKKGTLASGRQIRREILTENATQKLLLELLPAFKERNGGYTRIIKLAPRRGDNAPMARLALVLNDVKSVDTPVLKAIPAKSDKKPAAKATTKAKPAAKPKAEEAAAAEESK